MRFHGHKVLDTYSNITDAIHNILIFLSDFLFTIKYIPTAKPDINTRPGVCNPRLSL